MSMQGEALTNETARQGQRIRETETNRMRVDQAARDNRRAVLRKGAVMKYTIREITRLSNGQDLDIEYPIILCDADGNKVYYERI